MGPNLMYHILSEGWGLSVTLRESDIEHTASSKADDQNQKYNK